MKISTKCNLIVGFFFFFVIVSVFYSYCGGLHVCYSFPFFNGFGRGTQPTRLTVASYMMETKSGMSHDGNDQIYKQTESQVKTVYFHSKHKEHKKVLTHAKDHGPPADITGTVAMDILRRANVSEDQANRALYREEKVDHNIDRNDSRILKSSLKSAEKSLKVRKGPGSRKTSFNFNPIRRPPRKFRGPYRIQRKRMRKRGKMGEVLKKDNENQEQAFYRHFMNSLGLRYLDTPKYRSNETLQLSAKKPNLEYSGRQRSINIVLPNKKFSDEGNERKTPKQIKTESILNDAVDVKDIQVHYKNKTKAKVSKNLGRDMDIELKSSLNMSFSTEGGDLGKHDGKFDRNLVSNKDDIVVEPEARTSLSLITKIKSSKLHKKSLMGLQLNLTNIAKSAQESAKRNNENHTSGSNDKNETKLRGRKQYTNRLSNESNTNYAINSGESTTAVKIIKGTKLDKEEPTENANKSSKHDGEDAGSNVGLHGNKEKLQAFRDRMKRKNDIEIMQNSSKETGTVAHKDSDSLVKPLTIVLPKRLSNVSVAPKQDRLPRKNNNTDMMKALHEFPINESNDALNKSKQSSLHKSRGNDFQPRLRSHISDDNETQGFKVNATLRNDFNSNDHKASVKTNEMNATKSPKRKTNFPTIYHEEVTLPRPKVLKHKGKTKYSSDAEGPLPIKSPSKHKTGNPIVSKSNKVSKARPISLKELTRSVRNIRDEHTRKALTTALEKDQKKMQTIANDIKLTYERKNKPFRLSRVLRDLVKRPDIPDENDLKRIISESRDKTLVRVKRVRRTRPLRERSGASDVALVRVKRKQSESIPIDRADKTLIRVKRKNTEEFDKPTAVKSTRESFLGIPLSRNTKSRKKSRALEHNNIIVSHKSVVLNSGGPSLKPIGTLHKSKEHKKTTKEDTSLSKEVKIRAKQSQRIIPVHNSGKALLRVKRIDPDA